ncbi:Cupredoxin [Lyophyllum atratum]|nr:Cupredoxin [Lyophyllum atratum]
MIYASTFGFVLAALPAALAASIDVSVGAGGKLAFDPQFVTAEAGDMVNFVFHPKNHTVTQSSFEQPCVPLQGGADSGFMPVAAETTDLPNFQFHVVDTNPVWIHCQQKGHCGQGMVFAINAPADPSPKSFKAFQDLAIATNGTAASTDTTAGGASTSSYVTPPAPQWQTATATVTWANSVYTTTYTSYDGTPPPTPAPQPADHKIVVGVDGQLAYGPSNITAAIGDTVTFEFHPKNHTVTQSSFLNPCKALAETSTTGQVGFKSGFRPVAADATEFPTFKITINDTAPIWGYCGQTNHCSAGMVFSINAVESGPNNFAAFVELAKRSNATSTSSGGTGTGSPKPTSGAVLGATIPFTAIVGLGALAVFFSML